jgi:hypothetical protein
LGRWWRGFKEAHTALLEKKLVGFFNKTERLAKGGGNTPVHVKLRSLVGL